ncbi:SprT family protein [Lapidilactobacillus mulanensis]|uniref:SprT family protein n=1 Tax=Lapidilactobacillus mulanensis TaxID=2485999 RepID=A0ABW4DQM2_9LACO|nr:SprT family protein [Lapidilactobacillus mulanensis]
MTDEALQKLVEEISLRDFHRPFKHQAYFNARLTTTGGRYHIVDHHLDFNPRMATELPPEQFAGIIKHELCHYHLHLLGLPYQHHTREFKQLLLQVGGSRYAPRLTSQTYRYHYYCATCHLDYYRQRKINLRRYGCGHCHGKLMLVTAQRVSQ